MTIRVSQPPAYVFVLREAQITPAGTSLARSVSKFTLGSRTKLSGAGVVITAFAEISAAIGRRAASLGSFRVIEDRAFLKCGLHLGEVTLPEPDNLRDR